MWDQKQSAKLKPLGSFLPRIVIKNQLIDQHILPRHLSDCPCVASDTDCLVFCLVPVEFIQSVSPPPLRRTHPLTNMFHLQTPPGAQSFRIGYIVFTFYYLRVALGVMWLARSAPLHHQNIVSSLLNSCVMPCFLVQCHFHSLYGFGDVSPHAS